MKKILYIYFLLLISLVRAQDTIPKLKLRLFDLNPAATVTGKESANLSMDYVRSFTKADNPFLQQNYIAGYGDTARYRNYPRGPKRNPYRQMRPNYGSTYGQTGLNASFKFVDEKRRFIERIKPRIGFYHSSRKFFSYSISQNEHRLGDTLFFSDPQYPPVLPRDTGIFRNINYQYKSKQLYFELGCNIDIYRTRFFILYSGILYGYGMSYKNEFSVRKDEINYGEYTPFSTTETAVKQASSQSSRITIPMGVLIRFSKKQHFAPGFYAECSPGYETYKIKGGRSLGHMVCAFTWGIRFTFQPHRAS